MNFWILREFSLFADSWLRLAAAQNYAFDKYQLGVLYEEGLEGVVVKSSCAAVKWYKTAADQRYPKAMIKLGKCYIDNLKKNYALGRA